MISSNKLYDAELEIEDVDDFNMSGDSKSTSGRRKAITKKQEVISWVNAYSAG
jgi:hypothetical protein